MRKPAIVFFKEGKKLERITSAVNLSLSISFLLYHSIPVILRQTGAAAVSVPSEYKYKGREKKRKKPREKVPPGNIALLL